MNLWTYVASGASASLLSLTGVPFSFALLFRKTERRFPILSFRSLLDRKNRLFWGNGVWFYGSYGIHVISIKLRKKCFQNLFTSKSFPLRIRLFAAPGIIINRSTIEIKAASVWTCERLLIINCDLYIYIKYRFSLSNDIIIRYLKRIYFSLKSTYLLLKYFLCILSLIMINNFVIKDKKIRKNYIKIRIIK